jgi:hypothetical protein
MSDELQVETTQQPDPADVEQSQQAVTSGSEADPQAAQVEEQKQDKTPAWVERRFSEMTRARHDAQREAEVAKAEADTYKRLLEATQRGEQAAPNQQPVVRAPVNDDERIQQAAQKLNEQQSFNQRCNSVFETGKAEFPTFEDSVKNLGMMGVSQDFIAGVVGLDDAHKVLHALGSNPDKAIRILSLPALQQGRELERLASKVPAKAASKPVSNAPDPITNTTNASGKGGKALSDMSIDEFMAARNSQPKR